MTRTAGGDDTERWVRATPDQVSTELDGEVVILDVAAGRYFGIRGVGAWIWERVQDPIRVEDLLDGMLDTYDVDPEVGRRDLKAFLADLRDRGLVEITRAPPG